MLEFHKFVKNSSHRSWYPDIWW